MGVTFVAREPGGHFCRQIQLIEGDEKFHYAWIKNYDRLLTHDHKHPKVFCRYCCYGFQKNRNGLENLRKHELNCEPYGPQRTELPKDNWVYFKENTKMQRIPFQIRGYFFHCVNQQISQSH